MGLLWIIIITIIIAIIVVYVVNASDKAAKEQAEYYEKISEKNKLEGIEKDKIHKKRLIEQYPELGEPTTEICFHKHIFEDKGIITRAKYYEYGWLCNSIIVWQDKKTFLILGEGNAYIENPFPLSIQKPLSFNSLVSCEATDDAEIIRGNGQSVTKTSKLGMITRGVVGGTLFGGVGALAGTMTANTTTQTSFNADIVRHNYKIHLTIDDFSCPLLTMEFGESETQMRQVLAVLNLIIKNS